MSTLLMTRRILISIIVALIYAAPSFSKGEVKVRGSYRYYLPSDVTEKQARAYALQQARIMALGESFGTYISGTTTSLTTDDSERFHEFSTIDVAGVWIKTTSEKVERRIEGEEIVIDAYVEGLARKRDTAVPEFDVALGRVDDSNRFIPATIFRNRERFDIRFSSHQDGYLAIYVFDGINNVARLLPEASANLAEPVPVERGHVYRFFENCTPVMTLNDDEESAVLKITMLFRPADGRKPFILPIDHRRISVEGDVLGFDLSPKEYVDWINIMMSDPTVQRRDIHVSIKR